MRRRGLLVVAVLLAQLTAGPVPAAAEWFADLYFGGAFTLYDDLTARFGSTFQNLEDVEYDDSVIFGGRVGYWFERPIFDRLHVGLGVDAFRFEPDVDFQTVDGTQAIGGLATSGTFTVLPIDISVVAVSLDLMLRWPVFVSPEFPRGRLQPYLAVGPAVFFTEAEDSGNFAPANQSETDTTVGFKFGAGVAWHLLRNLAVFGEYRFTYFSPEWNFSDNGASGKLEADISTFYFLVGLSLRF
jgi:opacity protein-like surface antigen